jgi:hypothetical protein
MPAVIAVDREGLKLAQVALVPYFGDLAVSDLAYAGGTEQAMARDWVLDESVGAHAAVRIDQGWPRIIAWHRLEPEACASQPRFDSDRLSHWDDTWNERLSRETPSRPTDGLVEIAGLGAKGAGLLLVVRERLRACERD